MRKFFLFLFSLLIGIGILAWILKTIGWQEIQSAFLVFAGWQGVVILVLTFLPMLIRSLIWQSILKEKGANISFQKLFRIYLASFSIRFLVPTFVLADEIFQTQILKEGNSLSWSKRASSVVIERILEWTVNLLIIFLGILFFLSWAILLPKNLMIIFGGIFFASFFGILYFYFKAFKKESIVKAFGKIFYRRLDNQPLEIEKEIFEFFHFKKASTWKGLSLSFLRAGVTYLRAWLLLFYLGKNLGILPTFSIFSFTFLAATIPIPASLGTHEVIQVFAFDSLNLRLGTATAFTMIIRGAELAVALIGAMFLFRFGVGFIKSILGRNKIEANQLE